MRKELQPLLKKAKKENVADEMVDILHETIEEVRKHYIDMNESATISVFDTTPLLERIRNLLVSN